MEHNMREVSRWTEPCLMAISCIKQWNVSAKHTVTRWLKGWLNIYLAQFTWFGLLFFCELIFFSYTAQIKAGLFFGHLGTADQTVTTTLTFIFSSYKVDPTNSCLFTHPTDGAALAFVWCCVSGGVPAAVIQTLTSARPSFWFRQKGAFLVFPQGACFPF